MGPCSITSRCFDGSVGAGSGADFLEELESERRIVPLGFTRPVPWTKPPLPRAAVFFWRIVGATFSVCFVAVERLAGDGAGGLLSGRTGGRLRGELLGDGYEGSLGKDLLGAAHAPGGIDLKVEFHSSLGGGGTGEDAG